MLAWLDVIYTFGALREVASEPMPGGVGPECTIKHGGWVRERSDAATITLQLSATDGAGRLEACGGVAILTAALRRADAERFDVVTATILAVLVNLSALPAAQACTQAITHHTWMHPAAHTFFLAHRHRRGSLRGRRSPC